MFSDALEAIHVYPSCEGYSRHPIPTGVLEWAEAQVAQPYVRVRESGSDHDRRLGRQ